MSFGFYTKPLGFVCSNTLLQNGSLWPLYLNEGGFTKMCYGVAVGFFTSSVAVVALLTLSLFAVPANTHPRLD